jgi:hypothetical protein
MTMIKTYKEKAEGKLKQVQGDLNQKRGGIVGIKGGLQKMEGKLQEAAADTKIEMEKEDSKRDAKNEK